MIKFVSIPDFLNFDIGTREKNYGDWSQSFEDAINKVLDAVVAEQPDFVLVPGDTGMCRWHKDTQNQQIFGPVSTLQQQKDAINRAANHYYPIWKQRFDSRHLTYYVVPGDHEYGDNDGATKLLNTDLFSTYQQAYDRHFTSSRFYNITKDNALLVGVNTFGIGDGTPTLSNEDIIRLNELLKASTHKHKFVFGHVPIIPDTPKENSSGLHYVGGINSTFWDVMQQYGVKLYLCGEVHKWSVRQHAGITQIAHGGLLGYNSSYNFLVVTIDGDHIRCEVKAAPCFFKVHEGWLWQTDAGAYPFSGVTIGNFVTVRTHDIGDPPVPENVITLDEQHASLFGTWHPNSKHRPEAHEGDNKYSITDGSKAIWDLNANGVTSGRYKVEAKWRKHENRATNAPATITGHASKLIDQRNQGNNWIVIWSDIKIADAAELKIEKTATTDGYIIADGWRFTRLGDQPNDPIVSGSRVSMKKSQWETLGGTVE